MDRWHIITLVFFVLGFLVLGYIGGDLQLVSYSTGLLLLGAVYIPNLLANIAIYIQADPQEKNGYRIQLILAAVFYTFVLFWRLSH
ncbi:hypothetical protein [Saccharibacillus sp. JS10]|uniref:hypothetical protein n=1 Tax=Saccharibacillus sp. JS10 TaxID=2950552 RepID=UPI00210B93AE|nr:hypothetical protein [Saccharibacillus sp. JS10]MCQ4085684.1 hypothetical protein [Saccharibacillus sp. JS10]